MIPPRSITVLVHVMLCGGIMMDNKHLQLWELHGVECPLHVFHLYVLCCKLSEFVCGALSVGGAARVWQRRGHGPG